MCRVAFNFQTGWRIWCLEPVFLSMFYTFACWACVPKWVKCSEMSSARSCPQFQCCTHFGKHLCSSCRRQHAHGLLTLWQFSVLLSGYVKCFVVLALAQCHSCLIHYLGLPNQKSDQGIISLATRKVCLYGYLIFWVFVWVSWLTLRILCYRADALIFCFHFSMFSPHAVFKQKRNGTVAK